ncbi:MAG: insulinase family protein, partial [Acidobacteria bacterium]|nr:insulinase family protein [Acidobacteriota bacterium]
MTSVDRSQLPPVTGSAPATFPAIARTLGAGGLRIWTIPHSRTELVTLALLIPAGSAADPSGRAGLAGFTADLLDDGTRARDGIQLHEELGRLGARFGADVSSDATVLSASALARHAREVLALLLEVATEPRFEGADVDRVRTLRLNRIAQLRHAAGAVANRTWRRVLYGEHPYGHSALGETETLSPLDGGEVRGFHAAHYRLDRATLVIAGNDDALETAAQAAGGGRAVTRSPAPLPDPPADP